MTSIIRAAGFALALALATALPGYTQSAGGANWQPATGASGDNTYQGNVDSPTSGATLTLGGLVTLSGWFVDTTAQGWSGADDIQVFLGTMDSGTSLGHGTLGLPRPDVAAALGNPFWANSGWSATLDPAALAPGANTLSIYLHTPGKGWWFTQRAVTLNGSGTGLAGPAVADGGPIVFVAAPVSGETISTHLGSYVITGSAKDPLAGPLAIDRVQIWLNGEANSDTATYLGDADVQPNGQFELPFSPWKYTPITSNLYVYAHSDVANKTTLVLVHFILSNK